MKNWQKVMVGMVTGMAAMHALAHGPSRQKVEESIVVNASAAEVWAVVGDFGSMQKWVPAVESSVATGGNQSGAERTLSVKGGESLVETLTAYDATEMKMRYKIKTANVKVLPVTNYSSTISVTADGPARSNVSWMGAFYRGYPNNDPPPELNDEAAVKAVSALYQSSLANLKKVVEAGR